MPRVDLIDTIDDIIEIAQSDSHTIFVWQGSLFQQRFLDATPEERLFYAIGQHLRKYAFTLKYFK